MAEYKVVDIEKLEAGLTATANAIREKTKKSEKIQWDNQNGMASSIDEVFEEGKTEGYANGKTEGIAEGVKAEYDRFWDSYQNKGKRTKYEYAFAGVTGWNDETFRPKYDFVLGSGYTGTSMFNGCSVTNLAEKLESLGVKLDTTLCGHFGSMFAQSSIIRIPEINCTHALEHSLSLDYTFSNAMVETIDRLVVVEGLKYNYTFNNCTALKHITIDGVIGENISFQQSPLSGESLQSVISHLSDSAAEKTVTFKLSAVNSAFETAEGAADGSASEAWAALIATKTNWTISLV